MFFNPISIACFTSSFWVSCAVTVNEPSKKAITKAELFIVFLLIFMPFSKYKYRIGKTINVNKVAVINPPITTVANGFWTSAPALLLIAIGRNPREATAAVNITGLNLTLVPSFILSYTLSIPCFLSSLKYPINTIPFNTATPKRAINPTPAEILNGISRNHNATIPPMADNGIAVNINKDCLIELNVK